jgi:hypothetical protein
MADPRLNSVHLESPRRQEYRRAREVLLRSRGQHTIHVSTEDDSQAGGHTVIHKNEVPSESELGCWLVDGEFVYPLKVGVNTLGRSSDNDVVIDDPFASRRHCAILVHVNQNSEVHDTASKNGTYINGTRLSGPTALKPGDEIRVSNHQFIYLTRDDDMDAACPQATLLG